MGSDPDRDGPDGDAGPSLFDTFMLEVHGARPFTFELGGLRWIAEVPTADAVAALDVCASAEDVLDELLDEDLADALLDVLDELEDDGPQLTARLADDLRAHYALDVRPPGGWEHLVDHLERYGRAIEADLPATWPGIELVQWLRGERPWGQLWRLLGQLPSGSRWMAARLDDDDAAREDLDREADQDDDDEKPDPDPGPPLIGETYDRQLMRALVSISRQQLHATYAVHAPKGKGGNPPKPLERPRTARDRVLDEHGLDEVYDIFAQVDETWSDPRLVGHDDDPLPVGYAETESGLLVPD